MHTAAVPSGTALSSVSMATVLEGINDDEVVEVPDGTMPQKFVNYYESIFAVMNQKSIVKVLMLPYYVASGPRLSETGAIWR